MVTCNSYRHPALVAKMAATLDSISNGRLEFGIGAGWHKREYVAYGFPYPSLDERTSMLRESVHLIKRMWIEDKVTFIGEHYRTHEAICEPKPVQKPHPPIWIGGKGRSTLKVAAAYADGCNFAAEPREYLAKLELLKRYCDEIGRDHTQIRKSLYGRVILGRDEREVGSRLRAYASKVQIPVASKISIALRHPEKALSYVRKQIIQRRPPAAWIVGTPEQCSETLLSYKRMGAGEFMLYIVDAAEREPLRLFADKVMPTINPG